MSIQNNSCKSTAKEGPVELLGLKLAFQYDLLAQLATFTDEMLGSQPVDKDSVNEAPAGKLRQAVAVLETNNTKLAMLIDRLESGN